jgi:hypothetical protein
MMGALAAAKIGTVPLLADGTLTTRLELGRIQSNADWIVPIAALLGILVLVRAMYRRDAAELPRPLSWLLTFLRAAAFLGLLVFYLQPQWRSQREIAHQSRVLMMVDTSMSMNRVDAEPGAKPGESRLQQVAGTLEDSELIARLRKTHEVNVFPFNNALDRQRAVVLGKAKPRRTDVADPTQPDDPPPETDSAADRPAPAWRKTLEPAGTETRLGEALEQLIRDERGGPISGVVLVSDGGQNAGVSPEAGIDQAREARVPVFTVGVGSERKPATVRVYDFKVPARAYPGDRYTVTGFVQGQGMTGKTVDVELLFREGEAAKNPKERGKGTPLDRRPIVLGGDGEVVPVKFELTPDKTGRRTLCLRVHPPAGDLDPQDKYLEAEVEIVDRKNHVLLLAGGPTRDYQFLGTLLHRDHSTTLDILLQTAQPGISQEAGKILDEFPTRRDEMYDYDCIVAFDPNWQALRPGQIELLESWVGDQGGGLIVVAGAAYAGRSMESWVQDPEMVRIRNLYPVEFRRFISTQGNTAYAAKEPWPLDFTREGVDAEYLWLGDTAAASQAVWTALPGVYGFCPVRGPKPGATVLARFSDPRTAEGGKQPVYMAEQFYGSGRVFYMGSGELWRLRRSDPAYFDQIYTKLIRHVSQGRLLRQSSRGVLLVGQDRYMVGNTVDVRAQLTNSRLEPLSVPGVPLQISLNGVMQKPITLQADPSRVGTYLGQFPVLKEGEYRLELAVPESREERLSRSIRAVVPKLEEENPQRNVTLLSEIAAKTGGAYYASLAEAVSPSNPQSLVERLKDASRTELIPVAPNPKWEETWLRWLLIGLCGVLCLEWLIRRLAKLA